MVFLLLSPGLGEIRDLIQAREVLLTLPNGLDNSRISKRVKVYLSKVLALKTIRTDRCMLDKCPLRENYSNKILLRYKRD